MQFQKAVICIVFGVLKYLSTCKVLEVNFQMWPLHSRLITEMPPEKQSNCKCDDRLNINQQLFTVLEDTVGLLSMWLIPSAQCHHTDAWLW